MLQTTALFILALLAFLMMVGGWKVSTLVLKDAVQTQDHRRQFLAHIRDFRNSIIGTMLLCTGVMVLVIITVFG